MDLLLFDEQELPPLHAMLLDGDSHGDDWLDSINFAAPQAAETDRHHHGTGACKTPVPCSHSSSPLPISAPISIRRSVPLAKEVAGDSWESTQSLLAATCMDDVSMSALACSVPQYDPPVLRMVPVEQTLVCGHGRSAFAQQPYVQAAMQCELGSFAGCEAPLGRQQPQLDVHACDSWDPHQQVPSGAWGRSYSAPQLMAAEQRLCMQQGSFVPTQVPDTAAAVTRSSSHGSLSHLDVPALLHPLAHHASHPMPLPEEEHSNSMTQVSDTVLGRSGSLSPLSSAPAPRRPPTQRARGGRPAARLQPLKQPLRRRSLSSTKLASVGTPAESPRPLRTAARRSLVLTSAAADLLEEREDDSDASVDIASVDEGRSVGSQQGMQSKKKHNPWTLPETEALVEGVRIVGPGKWAEIKKLPIPALTSMLLSRSAVDLKDKWRNLTRVARLPKSALKQRMAKGNSDVPLELVLAVKELMEVAGSSSRD